MMEFGVKKIVFSSSATVYGDPEYLPVDEKHPTGKCTNPYGKTKYFMEEIIKDQCAANHVSYLLFEYLISLFRKKMIMLDEKFQKKLFKICHIL